MSSQTQSTITVTGACSHVGVSPQAYYQYRKRAAKRRRQARQVLEWVREERKKHPRIGTRKLYHQLKPRLRAHGIQMGRDKLFELLRDHEMLIHPRRRGPRTTNGAATRWGNLLRQTSIERPNQGWIADISYLRTLDGFCYMALISDVYSRKILGLGCLREFRAGRGLAGAGDGLRGPARRHPCDPSLRPRQSISKQGLHRAVAIAGVLGQYDRTGSLRRKCPGRTGQWYFERRILS